MATRTIGTEIVLSGEKQFNDAMKSVNSNLKTMKSDMALVSAEFADNADSVEALTAKQKLLQSSVDQHRAKVDALREMYEKQKEKYGENSAAADKYKQQLILHGSQHNLFSLTETFCRIEIHLGVTDCYHTRIISTCHFKAARIKYLRK